MATADTSFFEAAFHALTGNDPFPWQQDLFTRLIAGESLSVCNIPTGLGKTAVIAIWLTALVYSAKSKGALARIPRRLVYVVNRRTVVDQSTSEAERIRTRLKGEGELSGEERAVLGELRRLLGELCAADHDEVLAISTLRGQFADNRKWSADPAPPAVICGTVDMIGSRLLFSGYRIGFKSRPLHAGFLGQDVLLVHDEAHLEPAFQKLIEAIEQAQNQGEQTGELPWPKLRVMALSATARGDEDDDQTEKPFELTPEEQNAPDNVADPGDADPPIHRVWRRLKAKKRLTLHEAGDGKDAVAKEIAKRAELYSDFNAAVLVFVRTLDDIGTVEKELRKTKRPIELLTGTIRGKERDELVETPTFQRFLEDRSHTETVYLLCTSAGEVGIDISADHMVCDLSTFESMAQRLGRVHRYGEPTEHVARIDVVYPASFGKIDKKTGELKADEIDKRRQKTLDLLRRLPETGVQAENGEPIYDASPKALMDLRQRSDLPHKIDEAFSPKPTMFDATDILFDAWAMTTIRGQMPGRPEVAPYLHGVADDLPQTTIAWRAELDLIDTKAPDAEKSLQAIFTKHRIRPHETLTTRSRRVLDFLKEVAKGRPDLRGAWVAIQSSRSLRIRTVGDLIDEPGPLNADPTLILPASFGGLDEKGMLSADAVPKAKKTRHESDNAGGGADTRLDDSAGISSSTLDIADYDGYEAYKDVPARIRVLIERSEDGWAARPMPGGKPLPAEWRLEPETRTKVLSQIRKQSGLIVRLVQDIAFDDEGERVRSLVCLSPAPPQQRPEEQSLADHVDDVEREAGRLADALRLADAEPFRSALLFAAKHHDGGKDVDRWQRYIGGPNAEGQPLGKSAEWRDPKLLAGYRHEFGSLLRVPEGQLKAHFANPQLNLTAEQQEEARDQALHLIAAHHGYGRPHFANPLDDDFNGADCEQAHVDVIRRYARLQRKYGRWGLAYLESLLRAADWAASRALGLDPETDDDDATDTDGGNA